MPFRAIYKACYQMKDYSEVTSTLQRDAARLIELLEQRKYTQASVIALKIAKGMMDIVLYCHERIDK